ncbi:cystatin-like [Eublepharis macularius]|uniref:Cystatin-like n=1 Tax=Eublepharis macularius TaxID=481883 RepID=A0AA97K5E0_EUBMA|nr:cystatin-like [Eublepharis macularius]
MVASFVLLLLLPLQGQAVSLVGGLTDHPVSDPETANVAHFAVQAYNEANDNPLYIREVKLIQAQTQVVSGINYYLTMELAVTECQKSFPSNDLEKCQVPSGAEHWECVFLVWSQPWLNKLELTNSTCKTITT